MTGEYEIATTREAVYAVLNDENVLKQCIAGCEEIERLSEDELRAVGSQVVRKADDARHPRRGSRPPEPEKTAQAGRS